MHNASGVLDVAIGLVFVYLLLSLVCSALTEAMENLVFRCRGKKLYEGLSELFGGASGGGFVKAFYQNPLIYGLYRGELDLNKTRQLPFNLPSYIAPKTFALALACQILDGKPLTAGNLVQQIQASTSLPAAVKTPLVFLVNAAQGDVNAALANIENWYSAMGERVSGWYKKHAQTIALVIAGLLAAAGNVDTITLAKSLMANDQLRQQMALAADQFVQTEAAKSRPEKPAVGATGKTQNTGSEPCRAPAGNAEQCYRLQMAKLAELNHLGLPIGWQNRADPRIWPQDRGAWLEKFLGLLLTAIAVSLGAPFWFDLLNKFMNFRSSIKPQPPAGQTASSPAVAAGNKSNPGVG